MPAKSPVRRHIVASVAAIEKNCGPHDPRLPDLRSELAAQKLEEHIRSAPPLSAEQTARLRALLPAPSAGDDHAAT